MYSLILLHVLLLMIRWINVTAIPNLNLNHSYPICSFEYYSLTRQLVNASLEIADKSETTTSSLQI